MLDRYKLFDEASRFMPEQALAGRPARDMIDEREVVFWRHHKRMNEKEESMNEPLAAGARSSVPLSAASFCL